MSKPDLIAKEAEANAAKTQFMDTLHTLQYRLNPKTIANDVKETVKEKATGAADRGKSIADQGIASARARPASVALASVPVLLFLFRKPIARALAGIGERRRARKAEREAAAPMTHSDTNETAAATGELTPYEAARQPSPAHPQTAASGTTLAPQGA